MTAARQPAVESSFTLQSPTTQAARILASSLSRVMQRDTLQVPRARGGVQPAHPTRGAPESSQGGAALYCSSAWEERRGVVSVFLSVQPNSGQHCPLAVEVGIAKPPGRGAWEGAMSLATKLQESAGSAGSGPTAGSATHFSSHALSASPFLLKFASCTQIRPGPGYPTLRPLRGPSASCTGLPVLHDPLLSWRDWFCQFPYTPRL